ncbi:unnamed protein product [Parnassius apollo]|uniref:(apollo) hypothetical protein n=1 Tax=Parnassius apollo TaxID=110799 RepID=A0A8S3Y8R7_PARAO|nr:unnamed protein product [Parnassius apollo]
MSTIEFSRGRAVLGARAWRRRPVCRSGRATWGAEKARLAARRSASKLVRRGAQLCEQQNTPVTLRAVRPGAKLKRLPG